MTEDELDLLFSALASQPRRAILEAIRQAPGSNLATIAATAPMTRIAVMKHLRVLEAAQLVIAEKCGRERRLWFNAVPLQAIHQHWTDQYEQHFASGLIALKRRVETRVRPDAASPKSKQLKEEWQ
jgi:DNA-binding transcriptional ArsR family regulator